MTPKTASSRIPLVVLSALTCTAAAAVAVVAIRLANDGLEPEGRNWWLVAEVALGLSFAPIGGALLSRRRYPLGAAFVLVGVSQAASAVLYEWHALHRSTAGILGAGRWAEILGLLLLALAVPFLVPWPRTRVTKDPLARWLALGAVAAVLGALAATFDGIGDLPGAHVAAPLILLSTVPLVAVGAFVADARGDADALAAVSHRFLVWAVLVSGIAVLYTVLVAGFGAVLGANGPAWLLVGVTGGLAVVLEPARARLRHFVDGLVYGQRDDPLAVVEQLVGHQVATGTDVDERMLRSVADTLAAALRLDHVAIDVLYPSGWVRAAEHGESAAGDQDLPLATGDQVVGRLVVGCHESQIGARDRHVLSYVVPHVTLAVSLVRVTGDLRRSRLAVVTAQEEERRRLRRDLHDGIGSTLTGISLALHTVIRRMQRADAADVYDFALLDQLSDELDRSITDVKRIVRDLRPTALDDQSLPGALMEFARSYDGVIKVRLHLPAAPPVLPAAIEIAIYRIATEALTNVVRHAGATSCSMRLDVAEYVELDVQDDGIGIGVQTVHPTGVGLAAMRERAAMLGGTVVITPVEPHGTCVHASIPMAVA